jgi:Fe-S-cluster-containing dehydrogenase component
MNVDRRDFFKIVSAGVVTATTTKTALAEPRRSLPKDAVGLLYDSTLCIGCKACEVGCKTFNNKPIVHSYIEEEAGVKDIWDAATDLDSETLNKIKLYKNGTAAVKDREKDGFAFIKRSCMHCVDPDCISACPVSALTKNPDTGIVGWNEDACCGCRYCQVACPYLIPKFQYQKAFPKLQKCELCRHVLEEKGITGCAEYCPTGATIYGKVEDLMAEARKRLELKEGDYNSFPVHKLDSNDKQYKPVAKYLNYIYGEKEGGGTQYIMLSAVPFEKLGLPQLPDHSDASISEGIQHTMYKGLIAPFVLLAGLMFATYRTTKKENPE